MVNKGTRRRGSMLSTASDTFFTLDDDDGLSINWASEAESLRSSGINYVTPYTSRTDSRKEHENSGFEAGATSSSDDEPVTEVQTSRLPQRTVSSGGLRDIMFARDTDLVSEFEESDAEETRTSKCTKDCARKTKRRELSPKPPNMGTCLQFDTAEASRLAMEHTDLESDALLSEMGTDVENEHQARRRRRQKNKDSNANGDKKKRRSRKEKEKAQQLCHDSEIDTDRESARLKRPSRRTNKRSERTKQVDSKEEKSPHRRNPRRASSVHRKLRRQSSRRSCRGDGYESSASQSDHDAGIIELRRGSLLGSVPYGEESSSELDFAKPSLKRISSLAPTTNPNTIVQNVQRMYGQNIDCPTDKEDETSRMDDSIRSRSRRRSMQHAWKEREQLKSKAQSDCNLTEPHESLDPEKENHRREILDQSRKGPVRASSRLRERGDGMARVDNLLGDDIGSASERDVVEPTRRRLSLAPSFGEDSIYGSIDQLIDNRRNRTCRSPINSQARRNSLEHSQQIRQLKETLDLQNSPLPALRDHGKIAKARRSPHPKDVHSYDTSVDELLKSRRLRGANQSTKAHQQEEAKKFSSMEMQAGAERFNLFA